MTAVSDPISTGASSSDPDPKRDSIQSQPTTPRAGDSAQVEPDSPEASEERFRQLAENSDDVFFVIDIATTRILYLNPAFSRIWERTRESAYEDTFAFLSSVHPDDRQRLIDSLSQMAEGGYNEDFRLVRGDGSVRTLRTRAFPIYNAEGAVYRVGGISEDVTDSKKAQEELLAERHFLEHLLQLQERERTLLAYNIHDGFVQAVIAALMHLESVGDDPALAREMQEKLEPPLELLRSSIEEARRMISGLRPPILDEQGLVAAIEYLISDSRFAATKVLFNHDVEFERLDKVLEETLFRIAQEALSNVHRHSQAKLAQVTLTSNGERLTLIVEDFGRGFDIESTTDRQFGLRGIRERARLFGGEAMIRSSLGSGTRVSVELPVKRPTGPSTRA